MSTYVLPYSKSIPFIVLVAAVLCIIALASTVCWGLLGTVIDRIFKKHRNVVNILMALLLLYCAVTLLLPH